MPLLNFSFFLDLILLYEIGSEGTLSGMDVSQAELETLSLK